MSGSPTLALLYFGPVLEAQAILWLLVFSYASHSFLLVVQLWAVVSAVPL
jgi:hypothetical protein